MKNNCMRERRARLLACLSVAGLPMRSFSAIFFLIYFLQVFLVLPSSKQDQLASHSTVVSSFPKHGKRVLFVFLQLLLLLLFILPLLQSHLTFGGPRAIGFKVTRNENNNLISHFHFIHLPGLSLHCQYDFKYFLVYKKKKTPFFLSVLPFFADKQNFRDDNQTGTRSQTSL